MSARAAFGFLTRLPVGDREPMTRERLSRAAVWVPVVGLVVGGVMGGVRLLADLVLAPGPSTLLALLAAVVITGALHEDGLADVADAVGAHATRERRLEILRDPRVGAYGALAIAFAVLFAFAVLTPLDGEDFLRAALVGHVVGRWSTLPLSLALGPAQRDGSGAMLRASPPVAVVGTLFAIAVALVAGRPGAGAVAFGVAVLLTVAAGVVFRRALGGVSGDTFGAATKVVELGCYAALAAMWAA